MRISLEEFGAALELDCRDDGTEIRLHRGAKTAGRMLFSGTLRELVDAIELGQRAADPLASPAAQKLRPKRRLKTKSAEASGDGAA